MFLKSTIRSFTRLNRLTLTLSHATPFSLLKTTAMSADSVASVMYGMSRRDGSLFYPFI